MDTSNWLLVQVKPRQEMRALENLERQQGICYCPKIRVEKLIRGKRVHAEEVLFPGYLFINMDQGKSDITYAAVRSSRGVSKIVSFGVQPVRVPGALLDQIKHREQTDYMGLISKDLPQSGDRISITEGPFRGLKAVFSHTDGMQRSIVLINLLNQKTPTSLPNTQIKKNPA